MREITLCTAAFLLAAGTPGIAAADSQLLVAASTPEIEITPLPPGPRIVLLPDTTFALRITAHCADDMQVESAAISIADTSQTVASELLANTATTEQNINIPHNQLAPLSIDNFCFSDETRSDELRLYIPGALTAQLSLLCSNATRRSIIYQAVPLGMTLRCGSGADN